MESPTLTIRIPADLKKAIAEADDRSVTSLIVKTMRAEIERRASIGRSRKSNRSAR